MKDLTRSLLTFVLLYGTKDKARFKRHAMSFLEQYTIEEEQKLEITEFAYDFFHEMGQRMNQVDMISRGVRSGVSDLEDKLNAILDRLDAVQSKMDDDAVRAADDATPARTHVQSDGNIEQNQ